MPTLITIKTPDGRMQHCDDRCINARGPRCDCPCNGLNHGKGASIAIAQTREHSQAMIASYARTHGLTTYTAELAPDVDATQQTLF